MRNWIKHIIFLVMVLLSSQVVTGQEEMQRDTIYFFQTWEQMLMNDPVNIYDFPDELPPVPDEIHFAFEDDSINHLINDEYLAAAQGDTLWYVNTRHLAKRFDMGDLTKKGYVPVFFDDKVAYLLVYYFYAYDGYDCLYYYLDFKNRKVLTVNHKTLRTLLNDYSDLRMQYDSMKDNKSSVIVDEFFFRYIDRVSQDISRPDILDLIGDTD